MSPFTCTMFPCRSENESLLTYDNLRRSYGRCVDQTTAIGQRSLAISLNATPNIKMVHSMLAAHTLRLRRCCCLMVPSALMLLAVFRSIPRPFPGASRTTSISTCPMLSLGGGTLLACAVDVLGADHIVFGTSYPVKREWLTEGVACVRAANLGRYRQRPCAWRYGAATVRCRVSGNQRGVSAMDEGGMGAGAAGVAIDLGDVLPFDGFDELRHEVFARALIIEGTGRRACVLSLEVTSIAPALLADLREVVEDAANCSGAYSWVVPTHTFSMPRVRTPGHLADDVPAIATSAIAQRSSLPPARLSSALLRAFALPRSPLWRANAP